MNKHDNAEIDVSILEFPKELVLKTLMEYSTDSIYFKDIESRFVYINNIRIYPLTYSKRLCYPHFEVINHDVYGIIREVSR